MLWRNGYLLQGGLILIAIGLFQLNTIARREIGQDSVPVRRVDRPKGYVLSKEPQHVDVLVVGAGHAGLSMAGRLQRARIPYVVLEKDVPGSSWARRYERLHLHTVRDISELPDMPLPDYFPEYLSKDQVAAYQRAYAELHNVRRHTEVYQTGAAFANQRVLVVGFGNSGSELALDLWEHDAKPTVLLRSAVHMVPRWVTRIVGHLFDLMHRIPPALHGDSGPLYKLIWGDVEQYNVTLKQSNMMLDFVTHHRAPVQDIGTMELIRRGDIAVLKSEVDRFAGAKTVVFKDGHCADFDAVLLATGYDYEHGPFARFLSENITTQLLDEHGVIHSGVECAVQPRLYFVGFDDYIGRLAEMNLETQFILGDLKAKHYVQ
ncbi:uncharacterized protein MONBRDRAFT_29851 [Monosiga brevicollis MX1]|uniref:Flavin-containing monooxygenase n=1 Tax=Monosiga brevicollis TaxID=81824 RepID=A9VCB0_MONBE|nr:uncharacterized protein MONBRDRAFT_29851 [Monosiga brevicollis MX1]EDQ84828.1 predicted protein [Monosiga brevicollis MX1]|eukprot:XP_001750329.1 hypothetical protein [Monosiga brevicollis MX1]